jgi:hypothetical protein
MSAVSCQLTTLMRTEMKLDAVKELADSLMDRMSELQAGMHVALQDNSSESKRPLTRHWLITKTMQSAANAAIEMRISVIRFTFLSAVADEDAQSF